jgi:hypothetical protein
VEVLGFNLPYHKKQNKKKKKRKRDVLPGLSAVILLGLLMVFFCFYLLRISIQIIPRWRLEVGSRK